jgi:hypothetical protein
MTQFNPIKVKIYTEELARVNGVFNSNIVAETSAYPAHNQHPNVESYKVAYESGRDGVANVSRIIGGLQQQVGSATTDIENEIRKLEIKMNLAEDESARVERQYTDLLNGDSAASAQFDQQIDNNKIVVYQSIGLLIGCGICIYGAMKK